MIALSRQPASPLNFLGEDGSYVCFQKITLFHRLCQGQLEKQFVNKLGVNFKGGVTVGVRLHRLLLVLLWWTDSFVGDSLSTQCCTVLHCTLSMLEFSQAHHHVKYDILVLTYAGHRGKSRRIFLRGLPEHTWNKDLTSTQSIIDRKG